MRVVEQAYRALAAAEPGRIVVVDGDRPPSEIAEEVREHIRPLL
jgi:thymidylate kinase